MLELPFPLRAAAAEHICLPLMQQILCLSHVDGRHWKHISRRFRAEWYPPGKFIAHSEGRGSGEGLKPEMDSLWLLERGKVITGTFPTLSLSPTQLLSFPRDQRTADRRGQMMGKE